MPEGPTFRVATPEPAAPPGAQAVPPGGAPLEPLAGPPLAVVMRDALRAPAGRVVLRVRDLPAHRRRVARALLLEGALAAGGTVVEGPNEDLLLVGAEAARAERLRLLLDRLLGGARRGRSMPGSGRWNVTSRRCWTTRRGGTDWRSRSRPPPGRTSPGSMNG